MKLIEAVLAEVAAIQTLRRDIHAHPELGFQEQRTSDLVAKTLTAWGIPVHRGLGKTGVIGMVKNGSASRAVCPTPVNCRALCEPSRWRCST
jgi:metal-dependent amidase/aminoacylase/carboxypeptidase family protein